MANWGRRIVTGHDAEGNSVVMSDGHPPQNHPMSGPEVGANFVEIWAEGDAVPEMTAQPEDEPNERGFSIMPGSGHLIRFIELYPASAGGQKTVMHRTKTLDYATVIEGEVVLHLTDSQVTMRPGDVVVQRGTDHAWENQTDSVTRMAFFHIDANFAPELLKTLPQDLELMK